MDFINTQFNPSIYIDIHMLAINFTYRKVKKNPGILIPGFFMEIKIQSLPDFHQKNGTL